eukprot:TRINITY_DN5304_c0_g1_i1.p1 TRINITY_DN5304_c0_g1~~TRINITY_DN5304_c0_g1_i1.p1  ORF type:complete len:255 (-),score=63.76 TRINITY_DN5304_c0_g1_i1:135-899(-)
MTSTTDKKCCQCSSTDKSCTATCTSACPLTNLKASFTSRPCGKELKEMTEWCDPKRIKLIYFNGRGRAEISRLMMAYAEVPYVDIRMTDDWPSWKKVVPFGQLPCLIPMNSTEIIAESRAVERYVAAYCGLLGRDPLEEARIAMAVEGLTDMMNIFSPIWYNKDAKEKATKLAEFMKTTFVEWMQKLDNCVRGDYVLGSRISYADIALYSSLASFVGMDAKILAPYKGLQTLYDNVAKQPKIAAWIKARPTTDF